MANYTATRQPPFSTEWWKIWKALDAILDIHHIDSWDEQSVWFYMLLSYAGLTLTKVEQKRLDNAYATWYNDKGHGMLGSPSWLQQKRWIVDYITRNQYMKRK